MKTLLHRLGRGAAAVALVTVIGIPWLIWNFGRPPFDLDLLHELQRGMTKAEVRHILGSPTADSGDEWAYSRFMAWPIVYVRFDADGTFASSSIDD